MDEPSSTNTDNKHEHPRQSPVRVASFDRGVTPPPVPKRIATDDSPPSERIVEPITTSTLRPHHSARKHSKSRPSVNMAGLQTASADDSSSREVNHGVIQTAPTNHHNHHRHRHHHRPSGSKKRYLQSHKTTFNDAPTPPHRNGKMRQNNNLSKQQLGTVARKLEFDMMHHHRHHHRHQGNKTRMSRQHQVNPTSGVVNNGDSSIEIQASFPDDEVVDHQHRPMKMISQLATTTTTTPPPPDAVDEEEEVVSCAEEVAMEYNEPKRLTTFLIVFATICILIMLAAIIFAIWFLIKTRGSMLR